MNVAEWLRGLGLEHYVTAFRENEIGERVLPSLTADDLKELGVNLIGHRRLLLDAIAALREAAPTRVTAEPPAATPLPAASSAEAEPRQLTVMFCDIARCVASACRVGGGLVLRPGAHGERFEAFRRAKIGVKGYQLSACAIKLEH